MIIFILLQAFSPLLKRAWQIFESNDMPAAEVHFLETALGLEALGLFD
jgi:hypothetical protein